jgi:hypothetical protein
MLFNNCIINCKNCKSPDNFPNFSPLFKLLKIHILLTSRVLAFEGVPVHRVLPLDKNFAKQVFKKHYPQYADTEASLLAALLHAVVYYTLVIELLAKNDRAKDALKE